MIRTAADFLNAIQDRNFVNVRCGTGTVLASRYREILSIKFNRAQTKDYNNRLMFDTNLPDSYGRTILIDNLTKELWVRASVDARALGPIKGYVSDEWVRPVILGDEEMVSENQRLEMLRKEGIKIS
jgi:hypothetical protein